MFNNILKAKEDGYFQQVNNFVISEYNKSTETGFGTESYDTTSASKRFINELIDNPTAHIGFAKDFEEGLQNLNTTLIDLQKTAMKENLTPQNSNGDIEKPILLEKLADQTGLNNIQTRIDRHRAYEVHPTITKYVLNALKDFADWVCDFYCKHFGKDKNEAVPLLYKAFETMNRDAEKNQQAENAEKMDGLWKNYYKTIELIHTESGRDLSDAPQTDPRQQLGQQLGQQDLSSLIRDRNEIEEQLGIGIIESIVRSYIYRGKPTNEINTR